MSVPDKVKTLTQPDKLTGDKRPTGRIVPEPVTLAKKKKLKFKVRVLYGAACMDTRVKMKVFSV